MTTKATILYHARCLDGLGAAWAAYNALTESEFDVVYHAVDYLRPTDPLTKLCPLRDLEHANVFMVDFSVPPERLLELDGVANMVTIIDHHATAIAAYKDFEVPKGARTHFQLVFDNNRSGAVLTWNYFNPGMPAPQKLLHIEDRDLWKFELEGTEEIVAAMRSFGDSMDGFRRAMLWCHDELREMGTHILRAHAANVSSVVESAIKASVRVLLAGHSVLAVNCSPMFASDAAHELLKTQPYPFVALYNFEGRNAKVSLRSRKGGTDVAAIAKLYDGGGHHSAAGFRMPVAEFVERLNVA